MKKVLHDTRVSKIVWNKKENIVYKTLKQKPIHSHNFRLYKEFQKTAPVVQLIDKLDNHTYTMEYVDGIIETLDKVTEYWRSEYRGILSKNDYINLISTMNTTWNSAMRISKNLDGNRYFINDDYKLGNIAVIRDKKTGGIKFKPIDPDSWVLADGYFGMDSYYQSQVKIALVMQRVLT